MEKKNQTTHFTNPVTTYVLLKIQKHFLPGLLLSAVKHHLLFHLVSDEQS